MLVFRHPWSVVVGECATGEDLNRSFIMATRIVEPCLNTTVECIEACERCAAECGTSGNSERERCGIVARDCADISSLSLALMSRGSRFADAICAVHAMACDACAEMCAKFPEHDCCVACLKACEACAVECRTRA
jgi:hypothetical protein